MSDKSFKVKSGLQIPGVTSANILTTDANGNVSSSAILPITSGGTGQTSANNALNALLPIQNGSTINYALESDGVNTSWQKLYNQTIKDNGTTVTPRGIINIVGGTFTDNSGSDTTTLTIPTNYVSTDGGSTITASTGSTKGLIVKGATSQTANLQEWQSSNGTVQSRMTDIGKLFSNYLQSSYGILTGNATYAGGYNFISNPSFATTDVSLIVKAVTSQTANLQEWQNSAGSIVSSIGPTGVASLSAGNYQYQYPTVTIGDAAYGFSAEGGYLRYYTAYASGLGGHIWYGGPNNTYERMVLRNNGSFVLKGVASQTADLQQWQNSAGTVLTRIDSSGQNIWTYSIRPQVTPSSGAFIQLDSNQVRVTQSTAGAVAFIVKGAASQTANLQEWQNSSGTSLVSVSSSGDIFSSSRIVGFRYGRFGNDISYTDDAPLRVSSNGASTIVSVIKGFASQTANLQEWQNSSGTALGSFNAYGSLYVSNIVQSGTAQFGNTGYASASQVVLAVKGFASQTADLQQWQNSAGTVLASLSASGNLMVQDLTVNGTTTTINSTTLTVDDKNIELASVSSPTDITADGAGITIKGATDKTFNWVQSTAAFTSSEPISAPAFKSAGTAVSSNITLVSGYKYFVDTTAARTLTLPASPSLGDEIQIYDASNSALTNNITVASNSNKIQGSVQDLVIDSNAATVYLTYTGSTYGWAVN